MYQRPNSATYSNAISKVTLYTLLFWDFSIYKHTIYPGTNLMPLYLDTNSIVIYKPMLDFYLAQSLHGITNFFAGMDSALRK